MKDLEADVVVVGAGPAGSIAAWKLAENDLDVIVLEKKQEIGTPKRCAEGINILGLTGVGVELDDRWAVNEINGAHLYAPSGKKLPIDNLKTTGYVLERKIFEKDLAKKAIQAGARYMMKTQAKDVLKKDEKVVGVKAEQMREQFKIKTGLTIACDGVDSMIAKKAGLDSINKMSDYHSGYQYEMAGVNTKENVLSLYFGNQVAPKGYVWIFPKGDTVANVGIGILGEKSGEGNRARDYLDRFIQDHPEIFEDASPIEVNAGGIPVKQDMKSFVKDGFMVVGDAAQQVNPIHGGGIALAMKAAKIAAEEATQALEEDNVSRERLRKYEERWRETEGKRLKRLLKLRMFLERLEDKDFERFAENIEGEDVMDLISGDFKTIVKTALKIPRLMPIAKKFLVK